LDIRIMVTTGGTDLKDDIMRIFGKGTNSLDSIFLMGKT
jgi:hypothetical protein